MFSRFPVYFAAQEGHYHCAQWLVDHAKADPQLATYDGTTPLHAAAHTGQLAMARWLLRSGNCSIACRTSDGATPVHFAAKRGTYKVSMTCRLLAISMN